MGKPPTTSSANLAASLWRDPQKLSCDSCIRRIRLIRQIGLIVHDILQERARQVEDYIENHLFDAQGIMYSGIDACSNKPFERSVITPSRVPRRSAFDPWTYWSYEDAIIGHGLYLEGLIRKYEVTGDSTALERAHSQWRVIKNVYSCSQVYGPGSFLRPYGGYEGMNAFVEPLGTDQASPLFSGVYHYMKHAAPAEKAKAADAMLQTLSWYERQGFEYFYYKTFIHEWNSTYQHAASYYLPAIAWAARETGDTKWQRHLDEKMALFESDDYTVFGIEQGSFCWGGDLPVLKEVLGERFNHYITPAMLKQGYEACQAALATYNEPRMTRRYHPESLEPGFKPYMRPGYNPAEAMGFAYFYSVHQGRSQPRMEIHFMCALAALGYPGALAEAWKLLDLRERVPQDFTDYLFEDYAGLPEEVDLFARSTGTALVEWFRNYWMLRSAELTP